MSLPSFNARGDLLAGVHPTSLREALARFGVDSDQRKTVALRLERIYQMARAAETRVFDAWYPAVVDRSHSVDVLVGHYASNTLGLNRSSGPPLARDFLFQTATLSIPLYRPRMPFASAFSSRRPRRAHAPHLATLGAHTGPLPVPGYTPRRARRRCTDQRRSI